MPLLFNILKLKDYF